MASPAKRVGGSMIFDLYYGIILWVYDKVRG